MRSNRFFIVILLMSGLILSVPQALFAAVKCAVVAKQNAPESAVEVEIPLTPRVAQMITTTDGKLSSLFESLSKIPADLKRRLYQVTGQVSLETSFESLPPDFQLALLKAGIVSKEIYFMVSRYIPGIKVKKIYQEKYNLMPWVELGDINSVKTAELLELHIRGSQSPDKLVKTASRLQQDLGYKPYSMHSHIVMEHINKWFEQDPDTRIYMFVEYFRRLNLAMEMRDVVEHGLGLVENKADFVTYFDVLDAGSIQKVTDYLIKNFMNTTDRMVRLGKDGKMGWIGFFGSDKYDGPNLMGFELRFLNGSDLPENLLQFIANLRQKVESREFGIDEKKFAEWLGEDENKNHFNHRISVHKYLYESEAHMSPEVLKYVGGARSDIFQAFRQRKRINFLLHNWSRDPIVIGRPDLAQKIQMWQLRSVRRLLKGENETQLMQEFLVESGLYFEIARSVGFTP